MRTCADCGRDCLHKLCAQKIPVFSALNGEELHRLTAVIRRRTYEKGERIVAEGEELNALVILSEGSAKAFTLTPDGREQILYVFSQGDFFGERNLLGTRRSSYTVEALEQVGTCSLAKDEFYALLRSNPDIAVKVIEELGNRLERMERIMGRMGVRSLDERLGGLLLDFAGQYGESTPEGTLIRLPLSREGIANFLGVARETVSRKLSQLEQDGLIRPVGNRAILLRDGDALREQAGKAE